MKNFSKNIFLFGLILSGIAVSAQNVGINGTGGAPDASAMLDIVSTNEGLLIPRVSIGNVAAAAPVAAPATSLLVYNTNAAVIGGTGAGYYFWNGVSWERLMSGLPQVDNGLYYNTGANRVRLGGALVENTTITQGTRQMTFNLNSSGDFNVQDNGTTRFQVLDNGRIEMSYTLDASGATNTGVLEIANSLRLDGNEIITNTNSILYLNNDNNGDVRIDNTTFAVDASTNRVGIRKTAPTQALDVLGNVRFSGALMPNNQAGTANKTLLSQGAGVAPIWSGFTFLNTAAIQNIGNFFSTLGWTGTWTNGTLLTFTITDPNLASGTTPSVVFMSFPGTNSNAIMAGFNVRNIKVNNGNMAISVVNNTGLNLTGALAFQYVAFY